MTETVLKAKRKETASSVATMFCRRCSWPIIFAFCSYEMAKQEPYKNHEAWIYCSNKCCINHAGEPWVISGSPSEFYFME